MSHVLVFEDSGEDRSWKIATMLGSSRGKDPPETQMDLGSSEWVESWGLLQANKEQLTQAAEGIGAWEQKPNLCVS